MEGGIKEITEKIRRERESKLNGGAAGTVVDGVAAEAAKELSPPGVLISNEISEGQDLSGLIQQISSLKVSGQTKMLIRFDDKHMAILNKLSPALKINVVQFINFLLEDFFETRPDFKTLIKNSLKNSLKEI
ncbi:hypothetical protein HH214_21645 (plasmid) [Mucilaginibacter robiniae]|uniref:Uncharacterized protein n=1 Tax=Mucilaginibacter robiniae TaxID=2728022 RepID=A0A7L5ECA3_9SPHI|nr:hypothetical protein [Mucilaginibacter robiniae]QJD98563.1 hypothetical protein HH214_21645 [Mucilaginibacter robiniae]